MICQKYEYGKLWRVSKGSVSPTLGKVVVGAKELV